MTPKKVYLMMLGLLGVTILGSAGIYYMAESSLVKRSKDIGVLKADQEVLQQQISVYQDAERKVKELDFIDKISKEVLPPEKSQGKAVTELRQFAMRSNVTIRSLEFTGAAGSNPDTSQTKAVAGLSGVRVLPVTVTLNEGVSYSQLLRFLDAIETNRRKMQVTGLSLTPSAVNRSVFSNAALTVEIYLQSDVKEETKE